MRHGRGRRAAGVKCRACAGGRCRGAERVKENGGVLFMVLMDK